MNIEDFYYNLPENEAQLVNLLRGIVLSTSPKFREKLSYGVPYFFIHSRVCFIWPASAKLGPKTGVLFGFCKGCSMSNEGNWINVENRKEIGTILFHSIEQVLETPLRELIIEAIMLDEKAKPRPK